MGEKGTGKYVTCICEGPHDRLLLQRMKPFFDSYGLEIRIKVQIGIDSLVRKSAGLVRQYHLQGPVLLFFDEADLKKGDFKKLEEAAFSFPPAMAVPVQRKIEAWLMADTEAFSEATGSRYSGPLPTDIIEDPKRFFLHYFRVSVRQRKRGFLARERDFFRSVVWRWELGRARENNLSLESFCSRFTQTISRQWVQ